MSWTHKQRQRINDECARLAGDDRDIQAELGKWSPTLDANAALELVELMVRDCNPYGLEDVELDISDGDCRADAIAIGNRLAHESMGDNFHEAVCRLFLIVNGLDPDTIAGTSDEQG